MYISQVVEVSNNRLVVVAGIFRHLKNPIDIPPARVGGWAGPTAAGHRSARLLEPRQFNLTPSWHANPS